MLRKSDICTFTFYIYITVKLQVSENIQSCRVGSAAQRKMLSFQRTILIKQSVFFLVSTKSLESMALGDPAEIFEPEEI